MNYKALYRLPVYLALFCLFATCRGDDNKRLIGSWKELEDSIAERSAGDLSIDGILKEPFCKSAYDSKNIPVIRAMTVAADSPIVNIAGFELLVRLDDGAAFESALRIMSTRNAVIETFAPVIKYIRTVKWTEKERILFSNLAMHPCVKYDNVCFIVRAVPSDVLEQWYTSEAATEVSMERLMVVIEELLEKKETRTKATLAQVDKHMEIAKHIPGYCRYIYVLNADIRDKDFMRCMLSVLNDGERTNGNISLLAHRQRVFFAANANALRAQIPEVRFKIIEKVLHSYEE